LRIQFDEDKSSFLGVYIIKWVYKIRID
jgi:hypothetical protein